MKKFLLSAVLAAMAMPSSAAIVSVSGQLSSANTAAAIISAPQSVIDDAPGAENTGMQGSTNVRV